MKLVTLLSLTVLTSQILSQKMVFRSVKCDAKAPNLAYLKKNMSGKLIVLEDSVKVESSHPCSKFFDFSGTCCDPQSIQTSLDALPKELTNYYNTLLLTQFKVFKTVYAPFLYFVGAKKLRERNLEVLALFVEKVPSAKLEILSKNILKNYSEAAELSLDFTADAFCMLCASENVFQKNVIKEKALLTFGYSKSYYKKAVIILGRASIPLNFIRTIFSAVRDLLKQKEKTNVSVSKFEEEYQKLKKSDDDHIFETFAKVDNSGVPLLTFDLNISPISEIEESLKIFDHVTQAVSHKKSATQRLLQMVQPEEFYPFVRRPSDKDTVGFAGKNVTGHKGLYCPLNTKICYPE